MPVLEQAQGRYPGVAFVLVNQGEDRGTIHRYLDRAGLDLDHVLLDPHSQAMLETNTRGLPTTLFFNRSEEHTSELQSLMRISYAVFCLKKKTKTIIHTHRQ